MREFYGCYLLVSKSPHGKGRTYIGFTVNPRRRIRQHNGLITAGAWKTSKWRPWEMTLVLYGFPTKIQALQFEWAWQHPLRSLIVRPIAQALGAKKLLGARGKILLMLSMLHESPWRHFPLTLQYLHPQYAAMVKETVMSAPSHIHVFTAPLEELPRALTDMDEDEEVGEPHAGRAAPGREDTRKAADEPGLDSCGESDPGGSGRSDDGDGSEEGPLEEPPGPIPCKALQAQGRGASKAAAASQPTTAAANARLICHICSVVIQRHILVCGFCGVHFHLDCLAACWSSMGTGGGGGSGSERHLFGGVPEHGQCPACDAPHSWMAMLQGMQTIGWGNRPRGRRGKGAKKVAAVAPQPQDGEEDGAGLAGTAVTQAKGRKASAKHKSQRARRPAGDAPPPEAFLGDLQLAGDAAEGGSCGFPAHPEPAVSQRGTKPRSGTAGGAPGKARKGKAVPADAVSDVPVRGGVDALDGPEGHPGAFTGDAVHEAAVPVVGAARAPKPRAPRRRAAKGVAAGGLPEAVAEQYPVDTGEGGQAYLTLRGGWAEVLPEDVTAPQHTVRSPLKRLRRGPVTQPPMAHDPALQAGAGEPCSQQDPRFQAQGLAEGPAASEQDVAEPSPVPLWRRLQVRTGATAMVSPRAAVATAAAAKPSKTWTLDVDSSDASLGARAKQGNDGSSARQVDAAGLAVRRVQVCLVDSDSEQEAPQAAIAAAAGAAEAAPAYAGTPSGACSGEEALSGNLGDKTLRHGTDGSRADWAQQLVHPRSPPLSAGQQSSEGLHPDTCDTGQAAADPVVPVHPRARQQPDPGPHSNQHAAATDLVILGTTSEESNVAEGEEDGAESQDGADCGPGPPLLDKAAREPPATPSPPPCATEARPRHQPSPMDTSPALRLCYGSATDPVGTTGGGTACPAPDVQEARCRHSGLDGGEAPSSAKSLSFGSPVACGAPGCQSEACSAEPADGSAGGGVTALLGQLRCSAASTESPQIAAAAGIGPSQSRPPGDKDCLQGPWVRAGGFATTATAAADAAVLPAELWAPTGLAAARGPERHPKAGERADGFQHTLSGSAHPSAATRKPLAQVVDLCSPLPLSRRLVCRAVAAAAGGSGADMPGSHAISAVGPDAAQQGVHVAGKRLRSPKPQSWMQPPRLQAARDDSRPDGTLLDAHLQGASTMRQGSGPAAGLSAAGAGPSPGESPAGWAASPWPVRRRFGSARGLIDVGEDRDEDGNLHPDDNCGRSSRQSSGVESRDVIKGSYMGDGTSWTAGAAALEEQRRSSVAVEAVSLRPGQGPYSVVGAIQGSDDDDDVIIID